jgi:putative hemolysin
LGENEFIFSARLEIEYLNEEYKLNIPESDEYDTLAGFILYHHQNIPMPQDEVNIPPYRFKIVKVSRTKLELVNMFIEEE